MIQVKSEKRSRRRNAKLFLCSTLTILFGYSTRHGILQLQDVLLAVPNDPSPHPTLIIREQNQQQSDDLSLRMQQQPLNVLILYPDDWRHDDIGDEQPVIRTPFLSQLAKEGIRFTHNFVTTSVCWISRATLFSGQWVGQHGSTFLYRPKFTAPEYWNATWPYILQKKAGYYVGHVGKWQYKDKYGTFGKVGAFNFSKIFEGSHWHNTGENNTKIHASDLARKHTVDFLRQRPKDIPFALTVAFYPPKAVTLNPAPGAQWSPKISSRNLYNNDTIIEPNSTSSFRALPSFLRDNPTLKARDWWNIRFGTPEKFQQGMKNYYALITDVDAACGEIIQELKEQGIYNNTMIIFTTDNGLFHGEHGLAGKWYPYQESIRVPLIIYDPRMPQDKIGKLDDSVTLNVDLAETILGAAGIQADPNGMQGRDISDIYLLHNKSTKYFVSKQSSQPSLGSNANQLWRSDFYYEWPGAGQIPPSLALVSKEWKYIRCPSQNNYEQMFDLKSDPLELVDLRNETEYAEQLKRMRFRFEELEKEYGT